MFLVLLFINEFTEKKKYIVRMYLPKHLSNSKMIFESYCEKLDIRFQPLHYLEVFNENLFGLTEFS